MTKHKPNDNNQPNFEFKTWLGQKDKVKGKTKEDVFITLNKKDVRNFKVFIKYDGPLKAPIKENDQIGEIIIKTSNEEDKIIILCFTLRAISSELSRTTSVTIFLRLMTL